MAEQRPGLEERGGPAELRMPAGALRVSAHAPARPRLLPRRAGRAGPKMAASRYRRFLKLCEEWPVDETKRGRDLGVYLRQRVAQAFREGENTQIAEPEACDQMYESLARLHSNYYKHKYPRPRDTSFSGLSLEEYKLILSTDTLDEFQEINKSMWKRLQEKFVPRRPEEKHKAWAQVLSRPRT